jgi:hypothetical protein
MDDLACYGLQLRAQWLGLPGALVQQASAQRFTQRAIAKEAGFVVSVPEAVRAIVELSDDKHGSWI